MRRFAIPTLLLVFALISGACAVRQVRTRSIPVPPTAEIAAPVAVESVPAPTPAIELAPIREQDDAQAADSALTVQQQINRYAAREIAANDAANRAASEKTNRADAPAPPAVNDEIVAALKIDASRVREFDRRVAKEFAAMWREFDTMIARLEADTRAARRASYDASHPRPRPRTAPAVEDDGREAAVGSLAFAPPASSQEIAAPAAPSILPAPQRASTVVAAGPSHDRAPRSKSVDVFIPDRAAFARGRASRSAYLLGAALAACIGILCGIFAAWRRNRRLKALAASLYDHLPDGTVLIQEIVNGVAVTTQAFPPDRPLPSSEPDTAEQEALMDIIEDAWHADGDDMEEVPSHERPIHDRFDHTDAEEAAIPPLPPIPPIPPNRHVSDAASRLASGSGQIISSSDTVNAVSGVTCVTDPPREPASAPETYPSVIYESEPATSSN